MLSILKRDYNKLEFQRGLITIANSWATIEYKNKTGRSEAKITEIIEAHNLDRLANELNHITDFIICCGDKATAAVCALQYKEKLHQDCQILYVSHLGNQGLNKTIKESINGCRIKSSKNKKIQANNRILRLEVVAKKLIEQIK